MHFPMFIELQDVKALVVGAGTIALRKQEILSRFGANVTIVAPEKNHPFTSADLDGVKLVVAATNDEALNATISRLCHEHNIPVNVVDNLELSSFIFPAISHKDRVTVAVSTSGESPTAAKFLRDKINELITDKFCRAVQHLGELRRSFTTEDNHKTNSAERKIIYEEELKKWMSDCAD